MSPEEPSWAPGGWRDRGDAAPWLLSASGGQREWPSLDRPVLVTAFGPFPGQPVNPSELIVDELAGEEDVVGHVLDVSYRRAPEQLDRMVRMLDPCAVVCFGVASSAAVVRIETRAGNRDQSHVADVDGDVGRGRRIDRGPETLATRLDVDAIARSLGAAALPFTISEDAGGYVCNRVFRHVVTSIDLVDRPAGFVHVPRIGAATFDAARFGLVGRMVVATVIAGLTGLGTSHSDPRID